jgi:hypothetical protein
MRQKLKPWEGLGISRATWYRHGQPTTKPSRVTQAEMARIGRISLRTLQRTARIQKSALELMPLIMSGQLSRGFVDQLMRKDKIVQFIAAWRAGQTTVVGNKLRIAEDPEFDNWLASQQAKHNKSKNTLMANG